MAKSAYERVVERIVVDEATGCWLWQGAVSSNGYGAINVKVGGRWVTTTTHKVVYEHHNGPVPKGKMLLHSCDTQPCCAPHHLELGDQYRNMRDMKIGRASCRERV